MQHIVSDGTCSSERRCFHAPHYARTAGMGAVQGSQGGFAGDKQLEIVRQNDCGSSKGTVLQGLCSWESRGL